MEHDPRRLIEGMEALDFVLYGAVAAVVLLSSCGMALLHGLI